MRWVPRTLSADIVAAAWLIDALSPATWSIGPLPLGGGTVETVHGIMPVPAPTTALLLEGFAMTDDGLGASVLRPPAPLSRVTCRPLRARMPRDARLHRHGLRYASPAGHQQYSAPASLRTAGGGSGFRAAARTRRHKLRSR